ncbi:GNAT family N-acetyltransferase [Porticoccus sp. W117]|uniref:GNAT family N-acetyltransferase n=1 Tax=Porticoccus sp. W117 TaxID=3054777 RepID=UPI00259A70E8|nr:GNAT family N-acetyltransferase [Porticoccus sp. W117]
MDLNNPVLETERLYVCRMDEADQEWFYRLNSDPEVMRYTGEDCMTSLEQSLQVLRERPMRDYQKYGYGRWACVMKGSNDVIGWCGLKYLDDLEEVDVGYRFFKEFWGQGLGTEASRACVQYGLNELGLEKIIGLALEENIASTRVLEKSGLSYDGRMDYEGFDVVRYVIQSQ